MVSHEALDRIVAQLDPIEVGELAESVALMRRYDRKFLITPDQAKQVVEAIGSGWRALEVSGTRVHQYRSLYYDTQDFDLFRAHVQGRRRRYKVRLRSQGGSQQTWLELKTKTGRAETIKLRWDREGRGFGEVTEAEWSNVHGALHATYGAIATPDLVAGIDFRYDRRTLVNSGSGERMTMDSSLNARWSEHERDIVVGAVALEVKGVAENSDTLRLMRQIGLRPMKLSKYCVAVSTLIPGASHVPLRMAERGFAVLSNKISAA